MPGVCAPGFLTNREYVMEQITIPAEEFRQALCWLNGRASTLGEKEVLSMLRTLNDAFRANCRTLRPGAVPRFRRLTPPPSILGMMEGETVEDTVEDATTQEDLPAVSPEAAVMAEVERTSGLDSAQLINSIAYVGSVSGYPVTQSRAQIILYCLYGARLGAGKERLAIEHPQMWRYGPVFPHAFKRNVIEDRSLCEESYNTLMDMDAELMTALSAKTQAMMATPMADLNAVHKGEGSPYAHMMSRFPEKWGTQIPDEEIAAFFTRRKG